MGEILGCLCGIFVGITTAWYFQIKPISEKDDKILQLKGENDFLRHTKDDLQEDLSTAYKEIEMKDKQIEYIRTLLEQNEYGRPEKRLKKLKELVDDMRANN